MNNTTQIDQYIEQFMKKYLYNSENTPQIRGTQLEITRFDINGKEAAAQTGCPDYFCWKNKDDFFFVEAKSPKDSLHLTQVRWLFKNRFRYKLFYTNRDVKCSKDT